MICVCRWSLNCVETDTFSGYYSLYSEQKILYSKFKPEFIDTNANEKETPYP